MRIACLHTAHSNIAVFDHAAQAVFGNPARATLQHLSLIHISEPTRPY